MELHKPKSYSEIYQDTPELNVISDVTDTLSTPPPPILTAIPFQSDYLIENSHSLSELFVGFIRIARPKHWIKNSFVLAPLLIYPAAWSFTNFLHIILAFFCFCLWASSVYALNDVVDRHKDALHPRKSKRPIASGVISPLLGIVYFVVLALIAAAAAIQFVSYSVLVLGLFYLVNNLAYCFYFRNKVILDVMSIATGFVLRIFAGCLAVAVLPSNWMVVCGFSLAMLLGFGKRRLELTRNYEKQDIARKSLESYPIEFLNILLGVSSMMCLIAYMLYTISPETIAVHGTTNLLYTTPFVVYGVFRYSIRCIQGYGDGPVDVLTQDKAFIFNACAWVVSVGGILFFA